MKKTEELVREVEKERVEKIEEQAKRIVDNHLDLIEKDERNVKSAQEILNVHKGEYAELLSFTPEEIIKKHG